MKEEGNIRNKRLDVALSQQGILPVTIQNSIFIFTVFHYYYDVLSDM